MDETLAEDVEAAHRAMSRDPAYQQELPTPPPEPERVEIGWLEDILRFIARILEPLGPILVYALYAAVILLIAFILFSIVRAIIDRRAQMRALFNRDRPDDILQTMDMRPDEGFAKNLLDEADRLASEGRFGEAIRRLLQSSIQDMQNRIQKRIGISLTAREIGHLGKMPDESRGALQRIIHLVEVNVFALKDVGEAEYKSARHDYTVFAFRDKA